MMCQKPGYKNLFLIKTDPPLPTYSNIKTRLYLRANWRSSLKSLSSLKPRFDTKCCRCGARMTQIYCGGVTGTAWTKCDHFLGFLSLKL